MAPGEQLDPAQVQTAITANLYPTAEMVLFNGRLESITPDPDKDGKGRMLLTELETNQQVVFHYSENTQFYLQVEELAQGDTLNILHRGAMTRSLPPQGSALEVRPYAEPAV